MNKHITPIEQVIPEKNIVIFSPHYDDVLFMLGGYILALREKNILDNKKFHVNLLFSRSNYLARAGQENFDRSLDRLKYTTGKRLLEDQECINELLGRYNYSYELSGEDECFVRGKQFADSDMEFPHGMFEHFDENDWQIFARMKQRILEIAAADDTAIVLPLAFKEHIDHFITREAAAAVAKEHAGTIRSTFYFQEDKPYGGIATDAEKQRTQQFIQQHKLKVISYVADYGRVTELAFKHYVSQVEDVYRIGIKNRAEELMKEAGSISPLDRIYRWD